MRPTQSRGILDPIHGRYAREARESRTSLIITICGAAALTLVTSVVYEQWEALNTDELAKATQGLANGIVTMGVLLQRKQEKSWVSTKLRGSEYRPGRK